nr:D-alanyl-D-alanine carboxypeptidase [Streptomyces alfalfae]
MAYEEASVAGETPDRSKQRKSSGKPTAASVPAADERDPRLAVSRQVPAAREDRETAVFSTKAVAGREERAEDAPEPAEPSKDPETSETAESPEAASAEPAEASGSPEAAAGGEGGGDARLRDAVAAWVAGDDDAAEAPAKDGAEDAAKGGAEPAPGAKPDADEKATASAKPDARPEADAKPGAEPEADAKPAADPKPDAGAESGAPDEAADAKTPAQPDAKASEDAKAPAKDAEAPAKDATDAEEDAPKASGVDQATAVFKAPVPPRSVDQPTTMLKIGDHKDPEAPEAPEGPKAAAKASEDSKDSKDSKGPESSRADSASQSDKNDSAKGGAKAERDAERTSKFVALKPLDEPAARPAKPAAPATTPGWAKNPEADAPKAGRKPAAGPEVPAPGPAPVERTTQQPLPPRPPIDLLAELTNTPPPPETPVRTAVRRVKIWTPLVLLLVIVFAVVQAVRPLPTPTLALTAEESVSFDGGKPSMPWPSQGQAAMDVNGIGTFGTSGDQKPVPIASIAKVMTVYLILRDHPLEKGEDGPKIPVDAAAEKHYETGKADNESVVRVSEGQRITQYEALQAVMLPSANNIAKLLARWDTKSGSEDAFVAKMNETAKELGMKNTHYTDPSGLDKTTVSTAEDLVKLGRAAMKDPVFNEISRQPSYMDLNDEKQKNFFGLVPTVAIGIKTGTTTAAGGNILFAAEKKVDGETQTIIGAALGQYGKNGVANIDEVTGVVRKLIEAGQDALTSKTIVKKGDVVGQVDDGLGGTTPVVATEDVAAAGWAGLTVKLHLTEKKGDPVPHSAKAGTKVGVLSVGDGKGDAVKVPVALQKDLAEPGFGAKLQRVG